MDKSSLRKHFKTVRQNLPKRSIPHLTLTGRYVLSYASFGSELNTLSINNLLAFENKLVLPTVETYKLFHVEHFSQLKENTLGILEPDPNQCTEIPYDQVSVALIPALAFDQSNHRIGYGKGYYDRLLRQFPKSVKTIGLGYKEQLFKGSFPINKYDIALNELFLV